MTTTRQILKTTAVTAAAIATAATLWFAGAGTALAPESARLDGNLNGANDWQNASYTATSTTTTAYQLPSTTWVASAAPAGSPCATYSATTGTILTKVVQRSGSYARCV